MRHDSIMSAHDAGRYLHLSNTIMSRMRRVGDGPKYIRISPREVRYRQSELDAWIARRKQALTI